MSDHPVPVTEPAAILSPHDMALALARSAAEVVEAELFGRPYEDPAGEPLDMENVDLQILMGVTGAITGTITLGCSKATACAIHAQVTGRACQTFDDSVRTSFSGVVQRIVSRVAQSTTGSDGARTVTLPVVLTGRGLAIDHVGADVGAARTSTVCGAILVHTSVAPSWKF